MGTMLSFSGKTKPNSKMGKEINGKYSTYIKKKVHFKHALGASMGSPVCHSNIFDSKDSVVCRAPIKLK